MDAYDTACICTCDDEPQGRSIVLNPLNHPVPSLDRAGLPGPRGCDRSAGKRRNARYTHQV